jgi:tryptophan synthase alpha chain
VSNGAQAAQVAAFADGVIVGSAFVRRVLDAADATGTGATGPDAVAALAAELSAALRRPVHS